MDDWTMNEVNGLHSSPLAKNRRAYIQGAEHLPAAQQMPTLEDKHTFKQVMSDYLSDVNTLQHDADAQIQKLVAGETEDLHEVMFAMDEAETSFELMLEIRKKLVGAYQELLRLQI